MQRTMPELARLIFRSSLVSIYDVCGQATNARRTYALHNNSIVFIRSGIFDARIAGREFVVDANHVVFGSEGDTLIPISAVDTPFSCTAITHAQGVASRARQVALCAPAAYLMQACLVRAVRLGRADSTIEDAALALASQVCSDATRLPLSNEERARTVCAIKELMNHSLSKPVTLYEFAKRFHVSPFTVSRWFHADTGLPLRLYTQRLRLRRALTAMLDQKRSLTAIALELGFYDEPHFSKAFHAEFGTAPAAALTMF